MTFSLVTGTCKRRLPLPSSGNFIIVAALLAFALPVLAHADLDVDFPWVKGLDTSRPAARGPVPGVNQVFSDSVHGTRIARITADDDGRRRHEYSRRPAFNADSSRLIMTGVGGYWHLYRVDGEQVTYDKVLPSSMSEPNWHPTNPDVYRFFPYNGEGLKISEYNVATDEARDIANFAGRLPWSDATHLWTRWEGRPSADGNIWCMMAEDAGFDTVGLVSYDLSNDRIVGTLDMSEDPDHISTAASGKYCVPSSTGDLGTRAYTLDFGSFKQLHTKSEHSDVARDASGRDVLVLADFSSGWIRMADMESGQSTQLVPLYEPRGTAYSVHISGLATDASGYAVVSTYGAYINSRDNGAQYGDMWGHDRLAVVELKSDPQIYNVAYMRNGDAGYFSEPHATTNSDLSKIIFASTWGSNSEDDIRSYMVMMPQGNDPEPTPTISISAGRVVEDSGTAVATVSLSQASSTVSTVAIATAPDIARNGSDFYGFYRVLEIEPGVTTVNVPVIIIDDAASEPDESFAVRLFNPSNNLVMGENSDQFIIVDND